MADEGLGASLAANLTADNYVAKPMMAHINEAIERTSKITRLSPQEVPRQGIVRGEIPIYGGVPSMGIADTLAHTINPEPKKE
jgi:hypothetical protein